MSIVDNAIYDKIRSDNKDKYGTAVEVYGPVLLANLYSDRTHFIYELIQNAEDACERARQAGGKKKFACTIQLFQDKLLMRHNGIPFNEKDVIGICGIVEGTKADDRSQIGKFGIGFKSVYAYTKSPRICSGDKSFCIKNYVQPFFIEPEKNLNDVDTLFAIPFDNGIVTEKNAYDEISKRLMNLGVTNFLFLNNIEEIEWSIGSEHNGLYLRDSKVVGKHVKRVQLLSQIDKKDQFEEWLVFERPVTENGIAKVEIAFSIKRTNNNQEVIVPVLGAKLASFFLTEKVTWLKFIIQGPYRTTPARDNINFEDEWNQKLLLETAKLVADAIPKVKEMGLLDVSFLNTLPIDKNSLLTVNQVMSPVYYQTLEKLSSDEALLPTADYRHISSKQALLARGKDLTELLSSSQVKQLFGRTTWLDTTITEVSYPTIRKYLMEELGVPEIEPEQLGRAITDTFMSNQSDEWLIQFYKFLQGQPALWREKTYGLQEGICRLKPIIRLTDGSHTRPFDDEGNPLAFLPPADSRQTRFPTVKAILVKDAESRKFLTSLGLREPDVVDEIVRFILPKYEQDNVDVKIEDNLEDVKLVCVLTKSYDSASEKDSRGKELLEKVRETSLLSAINCGDDRCEYRKPSEIYIGKKYTNNLDADLYFKGNTNTWMLDERYTEIVKSFGLDTIAKLGCKSRIALRHKSVDWSGNVIIRNGYGSHKRGLDGFDPDCELEGLEHALQTITTDKSMIIWEILKKNTDLISGVVESSSRQDYSSSSKESTFSRMGELLTKYEWLPPAELIDKNVFRKPCDISLRELPPSYDLDSLASKSVAIKLKFKTPVEQKLMEQLSEEDRNIYSIFRTLSQEDKKLIVELLNNIKNKNEVSEVGKSVSEIGGEFKEALEETKHKPAGENRTSAWSGLLPEEEETIRKDYGDKIADNLKRMKVVEHTKIEKDVKVIHSIDPKDFLQEQYGGHCQICNTRLDLGRDKKPYFETLHLVETRGMHGWTDMEFNVLCLCPNCHALLKHGNKDLKNIWDAAEKVGRNEISSEPVEERHGDYYIIKIKVADNEKEIFYTPTHMAKLSAFISKANETQT